MDPYQLDAVAIRRAFDKAASTYDAAAILQSEVRQRLLERLTLIRGAPQTILDLGGGTGHASRTLKNRFPRAQVLALDWSLSMLQSARRQQGWLRRFSRVCATAASLPLRSQSIDWCVSNLLLAWCDPPDKVFTEVQRVLKPGGVFSFTTFGRDTLHELRAAWASIDDAPHVHRFIDMHDLGDALMRAGFAEPVMDVEHIVLTYETVLQLFRELKATGGTTATSGRRRHLASRKPLQALTAAYELQRQQQRLPATFEIVYGSAWGAVAPPRESYRETRIAVATLRGNRRE